MQPRRVRLPPGRRPHVVLAPNKTPTVNGALGGIPVVSVEHCLDAETESGRRHVLDALDRLL